MPKGGNAFDHIMFKIVLVGDSGVGKSNILSRFANNKFTVDEKSTIGVEFAARIIEMEDGKKVKMQVWDTAGQERYRAITKAYYRSALGALLVYDVTSLESFHNVERWYKELKNHANREIVLIIVGNKSDLAASDPSTRQVTPEMMQELGERLGHPIMEVSAKTGAGVDQAFEVVYKTIYDVSYSGGSGAADLTPPPDVVDIQRSSPSGGKQKCCN